MISATVNWPEVSGHYKVVQLTADDRRYLCFAEPHQSYHSEILEDKLHQLGISFRRTGPDPILKGDRYCASGMGRAKVKVENRTAIFYGKSSGYLIEIDREHLEFIRQQETEWMIE